MAKIAFLGLGVMRSTNMLERFNEEIERRRRVVRILPNEAGCLRLVPALAAERHERRREDSRCINMRLLKEMKRARWKAAARGSPGFTRGIGPPPLRLPRPPDQARGRRRLRGDGSMGSPRRFCGT